MSVPDSVEVADLPHVIGQFLRLWPGEVVDDGDNVAVGLQRRHDLLVDPIFAFDVGDAPVQGVGSEHEEEVSGLLDTLQEVVVELAGLQSLDVDEDGKPSQLQVDLQQTENPQRLWLSDAD